MALLSHNCWQFVVLSFATARLGVVLVPVNFMLGPVEIAYIWATAGPRRSWPRMGWRLRPARRSRRPGSMSTVLVTPAARFASARGQIPCAVAARAPGTEPAPGTPASGSANLARQRPRARSPRPAASACARDDP